MKKVLSILVAALFILAALTPLASAESELPFRDVPEGKWFYPYVLSMYRRGLMEGESPTFFAPRISMTRAEFVTVLSRAVGADVTGCSSELEGVPDANVNAWYADELGWAIREGFIKGYSDGTVKPNAPIVRQEMAVLLGRYLRYIGAELPDDSAVDAFTDASSFPKWAREDIELLRRAGVAQGDERGAFLPSKETLRCEVAAFLDRILTAIESITPPDPSDPAPENIGVAYEGETSGIKISNAVLFEESGEAITAAGGVGAHGGHETRIVRSENGTYATYITTATGEASEEHPNWFQGVATFSVIKITADGFRVIFTDEFPQANGSCTPNILNAGDGKLYVTIICDDKDRYKTTMGTPEFTNGVWLAVYEIDTATDRVTAPEAPTLIDHETTPFQDHGYGYTQPILDKDHGKLYAVTCGGEAPGYLAWFIYDLNTKTWDTSCYTVELPTRRCYINGYADGKGGFSIVIERCAPIGALSSALGFTFSQTSGYTWDALYLMHVADPTREVVTTDAVICEPAYTEEGYNNTGKNRVDGASHYGTGGCTCLDTTGKLHVIYTHSAGNTSKTTVYHDIFDLEGNRSYHEALPTDLVPKNGQRPSSKGFAMTQGPDGTFYVFYLDGSRMTTVDVWTSPAGDGKNFTKVDDISGNPIVTADGETPDVAKPIIGNSRNFSVRDGVIALMAHSSSGDGDKYYYFSVEVPRLAG